VKSYPIDDYEIKPMTTCCAPIECRDHWSAKVMSKNRVIQVKNKIAEKVKLSSSVQKKGDEAKEETVHSEEHSMKYLRLLGMR
jgi:hypothetical protein